MIKKISLLLSLTLLLGLVGCEKVPGEETLPSTAETTPTTAAPTNLPPETTAPVETTIPIETTEPAVAVDHIVITDKIPPYNRLSSQTLVMKSEPNTIYSAQYIHLFTNGSLSKLPYDGDLFWLCLDPDEKNQGSHYQVYALEDGKLVEYKNKRILKEYSVLNQKVVLDNEYIVYDGEYVLTYTPAESGSHTSIINFDRGPEECLVRSHIRLEDGSFLRYYFLVNLKNGRMNDFLSCFDQEIFKKIHFEFVQWTDDYNFIARESDRYYLFDLTNKTIIEDYPFQKDDSLEYNCTGQRLNIVDPVDQREIAIQLPLGWGNTGWRTSQDGRWLMAFHSVDGVMQLLIYSVDDHLLIEMQRDNPNDVNETNAYWGKNNEIIILSSDFREFYIYKLSQFDSEALETKTID